MIEAGRRERVLYLGIGDGSAARRLARQAVEGLVVGVDPSEDAVRQARRLAADQDNVMFVPGSAEEIPWREDFFSLLVAEEAALAGADPARAAREMLRVMAPDGRVVVEGAAVEWRGLLAEAAAREKPGVTVLG